MYSIMSTVLGNSLCVQEVAIFPIFIQFMPVLSKPNQLYCVIHALYELAILRPLISISVIIRAMAGW